jgi:nucleoside-diphosphate-sugar epimerase
MVEGIYRLLMSAEAEPVNLGNPKEFTVMELAHLVRRLVGSASVIEHRALPLDDPRVRQPDIGLARARLGWEPVIGLEEGLARTIDYFRRQHGGSSR